MKFLIQIASNASVTVEDQIVGSIPYGYVECFPGEGFSSSVAGVRSDYL